MNLRTDVICVLVLGLLIFVLKYVANDSSLRASDYSQIIIEEKPPPPQSNEVSIDSPPTPMKFVFARNGTNVLCTSTTLYLKKLRLPRTMDETLLSIGCAEQVEGFCRLCVSPTDATIQRVVIEVGTNAFPSYEGYAKVNK
eukprot:PhF_6_TR20346/c0_g1_i1/m.29326